MQPSRSRQQPTAAKGFFKMRNPKKGGSYEITSKRFSSRLDWIKHNERSEEQGERQELGGLA
jgi:hypothetical protein